MNEFLRIFVELFAFSGGCGILVVKKKRACLTRFILPGGDAPAPRAETHDSAAALLRLSLIHI